MSNNQKSMLAPCGINCGSCSIHLRTEEELSYWKSQKVDTNKIHCDGCRKNFKECWSSDCEIYECCISKKNLAYCSDCDQFPCDMTEKWVGNLEHHIKAVERLKMMKQQGT